MRFQSLLWWIGLAGRPQVPGSVPLVHEFQSLLWWIGLAGDGLACTSPLSKRFQSLLWWIGLAGGGGP